MGSILGPKFDKKRYEIWMDFWRVLGGGPGIQGEFNGIQLVGPGVPGEGRVRVKPSPKGCGK